jgi:hypothetical protein
MTLPKALAVLAFGGSILAATAFAQGSTESTPHHGSIMGPGSMHERMTSMMDSCERMMQRMAAPSEGQTDKPAPVPGQAH